MTTRLLSLQCELLMRIGTSLHLEEMLHGFLVVLTQRLRAYACQVWLDVPGDERAETRYFGYPSGSISEWLADDALNLTLHARLADVAQKPSIVEFPGGRFIQMLSIGELGCMFVESRRNEPSALLLAALNALMPRLAVACRACLGHAANLELLDLTRLQNAELEAARERQELDDRMKSEFLAAISHDMRTPLNGIIGFSDLLMLELDGTEHAEHARNINAAGRQLNAMFKDLLDIAKLDSHRLVLYPEEIDIHLLMTELSRPFAAQAQKKGLEYHLVIGDEAPGTLLADPVRLRQILNNLIGNALKYTNRGRVELRLDLRQEGYVAFVVADTGIGIPADAHHLVFERFRQVAHEGRRPHEGTGLGLAIANDLATLMGASISLESAPGIGSTFTLKLPRHGQVIGIEPVS